MSEVGEICPVCKQEKPCSQIFVDGIKNHIRYACKDCQYKELISIYGKDTADTVLKFINETQQRDEARKKASGDVGL